MGELLEAVLTPASATIAFAGGFGFGFVLIADLIFDGKYGSATANSRSFGRLVGMVGILFGGVFYAGQIASSAFDNDPQWPRAAARYGLFVVFSIAAGIGTWAGLRWRSHP